MVIFCSFLLCSKIKNLWDKSLYNVYSPVHIYQAIYYSLCDSRKASSKKNLEKGKLLKAKASESLAKV